MTRKQVKVIVLLLKNLFTIGKLTINKVRLYYFFSNERAGFRKYVEEDGVN
jgi:hypothetical protein